LGSIRPGGPVCAHSSNLRQPGASPVSVRRGTVTMDYSVFLIFLGKVAVKDIPISIQFERLASDLYPSASTKTSPFSGLPVRSIFLACLSSKIPSLPFRASLILWLSCSSCAIPYSPSATAGYNDAGFARGNQTGVSTSTTAKRWEARVKEVEAKKDHEGRDENSSHRALGTLNADLAAQIWPKVVSFLHDTLT
jgi:hypothetical protein